MKSNVVSSILAVALGLFLGNPNIIGATFNVPNGNIAALKNAIIAANSNGQDDVINLVPRAIYTLRTIDNNGSNGLPVILADGAHTLTINGDQTTIVRSNNGQNIPNFRIFQVSANAIVKIIGVTIREGLVAEFGGGIYNDRGTITLLNCTFNKNRVLATNTAESSALGGAILNNAGIVTLENCTVMNNSVSASSADGSHALARGGAIYSADGVVTIKNCTFATNLAHAESGSGMASGQPDASAGGIFNSATAKNSRVTISSSTFVNNQSDNVGITATPPSSGIVNLGAMASVTMGNSIFYNSRLSNLSGTFLTAGYNLSNDDGSGLLTASGDQINKNPKFGRLASYGGPTQTYSILPGSPAIDKGKRNAVASLLAATDQRGTPRPYDFPGVEPATGGDGSDIGAFELNEVPQPGPIFVVNTLDDHDDFLCGPLDCSLREAITAANTHSGTDTITFVRDLQNVIMLKAALPAFSDNTVVRGPGATHLNVSPWGRHYRIFTVRNNLTVSISGLTMGGGRLVGGTDINGAAILNDHGNLTITDCFITTNKAVNANSKGGAIFNSGSFGTAKLTLTNTTFFGNSASLDGGAIYSDGTGGSAEVTITNCTFSSNSAQRGAAIFSTADLTGSRATMTVRSSTFSSNNSASGGAIHVDGVGGNSTLTISNTILKSGAMGGTLSAANNGVITSQGHNISNDAGGGFLSAMGDKPNTDPKLEPHGLHYYGGGVPTIALLSTSPAINKAVNAPPRDARGYLRNGAADIGAFEFKGTTPVTIANISTRALVQTGDNVLIGGFIIHGSQNKRVLLRATGPSLPLAGKLTNPVLELHNAAGTLIASNDNWGEAVNHQEIANAGGAPTNALESAILTSLAPGAYTAIVRGAGNTSGIGLIEGYDLDQTVGSKFANISARGMVRNGDNVMIGGFIVVGPDAQKVIVRAIGPSLPLAGRLSNPTLELHNAQGAIIASNDNWRTMQQTEIIETGLAPSNDLESAVVGTLTRGAYTAIVRGVNNTSGLALVEIYALN